MGFLLGLTNIFAPVHEWCHVISASFRGVPAYIIDWNHSHIGGADFRAIVTDGWFGELTIFGILAFMGAWAGRRFPILTGGLPAGYLVSTYARGFAAYDFTDGITNYISMFPTLTSAQKSSLFASYYDRVMASWSAFGLVLIGAAIAVTWYAVKKRRPPK